MLDFFPENKSVGLNRLRQLAEVTQLAFTCLKLTIETLEQGLKYVQS